MSKSIAYPSLNPHNITRGMTKTNLDPHFVVLIGNYILNKMEKETVIDEAKLHMKTLFHSVIMSYKIKERLEHDRSIHNSNASTDI